MRRLLPNLFLIEPLDYISFIYLLTRSFFVLTDSGGIQEEAPAIGKPVLIMRDVTERPEGIEAGVSRLVGTSRKTIVSNILKLLEESGEYNQMAKPTSSWVPRILWIFTPKRVKQSDMTSTIRNI